MGLPHYHSLYLITNYERKWRFQADCFCADVTASTSFAAVITLRIPFDVQQLLISRPAILTITSCFLTTYVTISASDSVSSTSITSVSISRNLFIFDINSRIFLLLKKVI